MNFKDMSDSQWVGNMCNAMKFLFTGTIMETYFRNGHSKSQYLKFKDEKFNLQIRVSNHRSGRYSTKFQLLRCVNNTKPKWRNDGKNWILESKNPTSLALHVANEFNRRGIIDQDELITAHNKILENEKLLINKYK